MTGNSIGVPSAGLLLRPYLLILLGEQPGHGYAVYERLKEQFGETKLRTVYVTLRRLEDEGLVRSRWETSVSGPARRVYDLTPCGLGELAAAAEQLRAFQRVLDACLARCSMLRSPDLCHV